MKLRSAMRDDRRCLLSCFLIFIFAIFAFLKFEVHTYVDRDRRYKMRSTVMGIVLGKDFGFDLCVSASTMALSLV